MKTVPVIYLSDDGWRWKFIKVHCKDDGVSEFKWANHKYAECVCASGTSYKNRTEVEESFVSFMKSINENVEAKRLKVCEKDRGNERLGEPYEWILISRNETETNKSNTDTNIWGFGSKERILCSALWVPCWKGYREVTHKPTNIDKGIVLSGLGHNHCISQYVSLTGLPLTEQNAPGFMYGFLTSNNRFVGRREGAEIAYNAGQIAESKDTLYSEDCLWS